ncbi:MAG TPA: DHA2 family efflux MFS transporter permease subunit [Mycobacteriales bacterium]|nr:DHA2 family efflux MFS transporter permease subunit [Mycobacteriales bacterium]
MWRIAWVIVFGAFAAGLDASLTNIGLDTIRADLHADLAQAQWIATGYLLALAVSLPIAGWLGRRLGAGRLWLAALAAFTIASGLCAVAPSIETLIALRIGQGLAGGLLIPAGQTVLGQAVGSRSLGRVMATLGIAVSLGPALGPVAGGLILHSASWRWLFAINLPVGALGFWLGRRILPRGHRAPARRLDHLGLLWISTGLPLLVYGLSQWGIRGDLLQPAVVGSIAIGAAALAAFIVRTLHRPEPLVDLWLYRNRSYTAASAASGITGMLMFGTTLLFPLYFQIGSGIGPSGAGLRMLALGGGTAVALPAAGRLSDRYGGGIVSFTGCLLALGISGPFVIMPLNADPALIEALLVLLGAATALAAVPTTIAAYKTIAPEQLPDATTLVNIVQRIGGAAGAALFSLLLARGLPSGPTEGLHTAFGAMTLTAAAGVVATGWLTRVDKAGAVREPDRVAAESRRSPRTCP